MGSTVSQHGGGGAQNRARVAVRRNAPEREAQRRGGGASARTARRRARMAPNRAHAQAAAEVGRRHLLVSATSFRRSAVAHDGRQRACGEAAMRGHRRNFGNCALRSADTVNLNKCETCGTCNPSVPGAGIPAQCAGCGAALAESGITVTANRFTPPRRLDSGKADANEDGVCERTWMRRDYHTRRIAMSLKTRITNKRGSTGRSR